MHNMHDRGGSQLVHKLTRPQLNSLELVKVYVKVRIRIRFRINA